MIAGLPNSSGKIALLVLATVGLLAFALPVFSEDVQTTSATLDDLLTIVAQNGYISPEQETLLYSSFTSAVTSGVLTPDQALDLWDLSGLGGVTDATETPVLTHALSIILAALTDGEIDLEQAFTYLADTADIGTLSALKDLVETKTPDGIQNSISNLGESEGYDQVAIDTVLADVDELVAAEVPPGIALRVVNNLLRAGLSPDETVDELDRLQTAIVDGGTSPGRAANEVTDQGQNKNQNQNREEEMNQNSNQGQNEEPEQENEENQNGSSGNGKSSGSPEKGSADNGSNGPSSSGNASKGNTGNAVAKGGKS